MKSHVRGKSDDEMLQKFPIRGQTPGWFFRVRETSNNAWMVEGADRWGRRVSRDGGDPEQLLSRCEADALKINQGHENA